MKLELPAIPSLDLLQACPVGVLLLHDGRVAWMNPELERLTGLTNAQLVALDAATDRLLRRLLRDERLIELRPAEADDVWLLCRPVELSGENGESVQLRFYTDVTGEVQAKDERDLYARKVEELELTDPLTGLANRRALGNALAAQVTRSRRYHNRLSLGMLQVCIDGRQAPPPDAVVLAVSRFLRERLRWVDVIGRWGPDSFMLVLPETDYDAAVLLLNNLREEADGIALPESHAELKLGLRTGVAQWDKGMDPVRLAAAAADDLGTHDSE